MLKHSIIILILFVLTVGAVSAQTSSDDVGNLINPNEDANANACHQGGTFEGKCDSELMWYAGWYLIRFEYGLIDRSDIPEWLEWILPPEPVLPSGSESKSKNSSKSESDSCYTDGSNSFYFETSSLNVRVSHVVGSTNTTCDSSIIELTTLPEWNEVVDRFAILKASSNANALTQCLTLFSGDSNHSVHSLSGAGFDTPSNWYACNADGGSGGPIG